MANDEKNPTGRPRTAARGAGTPPRFVRFEEEGEPGAAGRGATAGGQAGDTTGLSRDELEGPESVEELVEEGQAFEAGVISGVEDAPDADQGEVRTRQVPEDDVPPEYLTGD